MTKKRRIIDKATGNVVDAQPSKIIGAPGVIKPPASPEELAMQEMKNQNAKKEEEKKRKARKKDFDKQLANFVKDDSYIAEYTDRIETVKKDNVIVRLFRFVPGEESAPKSGLITRDPRTGKYIPKEEAIDSILTNYAKVIVSGSDRYESGQTVTLPYEEIRGFYKNPEWEQYLESLRTKGATPIMPKDTRELIPAYEIRMKSKMFVRPWLLEEEEDDRLTLLVSDFEIETVVKK